MSKPWLKLWTETLTDRKLLRLAPAGRWAWVGLLMLAAETDNGGRLELAEGVPLDDADITEALHIAPEEWREAKAHFLRMGMLKESDGALIVANYDKRQTSKDPTAAERMRDYRARNVTRNVTRNQDRNVTDTPREKPDESSAPDQPTDKAPSKKPVSHPKPSPNQPFDRNVTRNVTQMLRVEEEVEVEEEVVGRAQPHKTTTTPSDTVSARYSHMANSVGLTDSYTGRPEKFRAWFREVAMSYARPDFDLAVAKMAADYRGGDMGGQTVWQRTADYLRAAATTPPGSNGHKLAVYDEVAE